MHPVHSVTAKDGDRLWRLVATDPGVTKEKGADAIPGPHAGHGGADRTYSCRAIAARYHSLFRHFGQHQVTVVERDAVHIQSNVMWPECRKMLLSADQRGMSASIST